MKNKVFNKGLSMLLALLMVFSLLPMGALADGEGVTVDVIVAQYADGDWEVLYPAADGTTALLVPGASPSLLDAMKQLDSGALLDGYGSVSMFFELESDWLSDGMWWCSVDESAAYDYNAALSAGSKIIFYYYDYSSDPAPAWDELEALISSGGEPEPPGPTQNITVDAIVAVESHDGWVVISPNDGEATQLSVSYEGENPVALDVVKALDSEFDGVLTGNRPTTFLGYSRASNGYGNWMGRKVADATHSNFSNFTTAALGEGSSVILYLPFSTSTLGAPTWDMLEPLITTPNPVRTPAQRLNDLLASELSFEKIKGTNISADSVTASLGSLPSRLDTDAMLNAGFNVSWSSNGSVNMSNSGTLYFRPNAGEAPVEVTMTATVTAASAYNADKYGSLSDAGLPRSVDITLTLKPFSQEELEAKAADIDAVNGALQAFDPSTLTMVGGGALDPNNVTWDISLPTSNLAGVSGVGAVWASDNTNALRVNSARGAITRPAAGESDATVTLTVTAYKNQYSASRDIQVKIAALTQAELDAANAELDAVAEALTFDVIRNSNTAADAVNSSLKMAYRGTGYPGEIEWGRTNNGYEGVEITWENSDESVMTSYGTWPLYGGRPAQDKELSFTATLTSIRYSAYTEARTVEIPIIVRAESNSAEVASITASPSMGLEFEASAKSYNLTAPAIADSVTITVKTAESAALISAGSESARGALSFEVPLDTSPVSVVINTQALDTPANTDSYTLNISRAQAMPNDAEVAALLKSLAAHFSGTNDDWAAMALSAYGEAESAAGKEIVENARQVYISGSMTDLQRVVIALTALGVDASNVLAGELFVDDYLDFVARVGNSYSISMPTEAIFGLIALNSGDYDDSQFFQTREAYVDYLLENKLTPAAGQTGWPLSVNADIDVTAMALAALAPYYLDDTLYPAKHSAVVTAVDGALAYLSTQQTSLGHYGSSNSTAMVIVALAALGEDANAQTGSFAKNGNSLIDGLLAFKTSGGLFGHRDSASASAMSTEQAFRALLAYRGFLYADGSAYNIYQFGAQNGDGTELTGESDPGSEPPDPNAPKSVTVRVVDILNDETLMPETAVSVSGTHMDALKAALAAIGKPGDIVESGFVTYLLGRGSGGNNGWMYSLNGKMPSTGMAETKVAEGDSVVMFYFNYGTYPNNLSQVYLSKFDKTSANVKAGESVTLTLTGSLVDVGSLVDNAYEPVEGASVCAYDASGNQVGTAVITGAAGTATLSFSAAGTYTVSAKRADTANATDIVPPLCTVTVESSSSQNPGPGGNAVSVYFTLHGLDGDGSEETWIARKSVSNLPSGANVADVITKALAGTGYTPVMSSGYLKSITTPSGFTLAEKHGDMPNSGWIYKVNSELPLTGITSYTVKNGDNIVLYFSKDYTKENELGNNPDGDTGSEAGSDTETDGTWTSPFSDVNEKNWFYEAVGFVVERGLFNGSSDTAFSPDEAMTRAMLITVLWRLAGEPEPEGTHSFTDVAEGDYYAKAVAWAAESGIVTGISNTEFAPNKNVTREQAAVLLWRYARWANIDVSGDLPTLEFADIGDISPYALDALAWLYDAGVISGKPGNRLDPLGNATRAELAAMLQRFILNIIG